jgi:hypothetical protein
MKYFREGGSKNARKEEEGGRQERGKEGGRKEEREEVSTWYKNWILYRDFFTS